MKVVARSVVAVLWVVVALGTASCGESKPKQAPEGAKKEAQKGAVKPASERAEEKGKQTPKEEEEKYELVSPSELHFKFEVTDWDVATSYGTEEGSVTSSGTAKMQKLLCEGQLIELVAPTVIHIRDDKDFFDRIPTKDYGEIRMGFSGRGCRGIWLTKRQKELLLKLRPPADKPAADSPKPKSRSSAQDGKEGARN